ncbi:MAG: DUF92 domain-containing protein [Vicinamibacterales bacterium]
MTPARADSVRGAPSETARQIVHMSMGAFALTLRWLTPWQAAALAAGALAFNLFLLPRFAHGLYRHGDRDRAIHGIVYYPLAVLLLIAVFPRRLDIAAAAWGILAIGDGVATLAGRAIGGARWPWNPNKTVAGSFAFAAGAAIASVFLAWWVRPNVSAPPPILFAIVVPPIAAVAAAFVETIPVGLDDNLSVAASAGAVLWLGALVCTRYAAALGAQFGSQVNGYIDVSISLTRVAAAVVANLVVAAAGYGARTVSASGAVCGAILGIAIFLPLGWQGWMLLLVTFIAASVATRTGRARKQLLGIAEERGGRRGPGNAIANTGVAVIAAVLAGLDVHPELARLAFVAALAAGGSDTIASEIGKAYGRRTWSVASLSRVAPGTSGAMSLEGTMAGVAGAIGLGTLAIGLGLLAPRALLVVVIASTVGAFVESWLGATLEGPGILNNDVLNFINTAVAAATAIAIARWLA